MTIAHEIYRVELRPGGNVEAAAGRLARTIIDRWIPGHAGGVHLLLTPKLASIVADLWRQVNDGARARTLVVDTRRGMPVLTLV